MESSDVRSITNAPPQLDEIARKAYSAGIHPGGVGGDVSLKDFLQGTGVFQNQGSLGPVGLGASPFAVLGAIGKGAKDLELLAPLAKKGDPGAVAALVESVEPIVARYAKRFGHAGIDPQDLAQVGREHALNAIKAWDPSKGPFENYAYYAIKRGVDRHIMEQGKVVNAPVAMQQALRKMSREEQRIYAKTGEKASDAQLAAATGISERNIRRLRNKPEVGVEPLETTEKNMPKALSYEAGQGNLSEMSKRILQAPLSAKEEKVLMAYYGINSPKGEKQTLRQIAESEGVSHVAIKKRLDAALRKMQETYPEFSGKNRVIKPKSTYTKVGEEKSAKPISGGSGEKPGAPVEFIGTQRFPKRGGGLNELDLYNLTEDIPGHPKGSTVSRKTLEDAGYIVPAKPISGGAPAGSWEHPTHPSWRTSDLYNLKEHMTSPETGETISTSPAEVVKQSRIARQDKIEPGPGGSAFFGQPDYPAGTQPMRDFGAPEPIPLRIKPQYGHGEHLVTPYQDAPFDEASLPVGSPNQADTFRGAVPKQSFQDFRRLQHMLMDALFKSGRN